MRSRPAALVFLVLTVLGGVFLLPPQRLYACSCAGFEGGQREVVERALSNSSGVFSGEVVKIDPPSPWKSSATIETDTLRVSEVWKGPERGTLEVHTALIGASCGYPFKKGQEYLVYAYTGKRGLEVDQCGQTKPLSEAGADLAVLGDSERPEGGGVLSDTSGGVPAGVMVGAAGLVMAASLLMIVRLVRAGQTKGR